MTSDDGDDASLVGGDATPPGTCGASSAMHQQCHGRRAVPRCAALRRAAPRRAVPRRALSDQQ